MSPIDSSLIERKLLQIGERLRHLEMIWAEGWPAYLASFERKKATEKLLQETIEAAIDINFHLVSEEGDSAPSDYFDSFLKVAALGWISSELASRLAPSAGLRNRLVHLYAGVDDRKIFDAIASALDLYSKYSLAIRKRIGPS